MLMSLDFIESAPLTRWGLPATARKDKYRGGPRSTFTAAASLLMSAQTGCEATATDCLHAAARGRDYLPGERRGGFCLHAYNVVYKPGRVNSE